MPMTISGSGSVTGLSVGGLPDGTVAPEDLVQKLTAGAALSATGTSLDFTGIPAWVKRITVPFSGISTNGTSILIFQIGDSGGIETTGYVGTTAQAATTPSIAVVGYTSGFAVNSANVAVAAYHGVAVLALVDPSTNTWSFSINAGRGDSVTTCTWGGGSKALSATLDRIRLTTTNGTDTFDAGIVNVLYEG